MKTLFITYSYLGGNGGGVYASRTHINLFAALSERMTLVYPDKKGEFLHGINANSLELVPVHDTRSNFKKFFDLVVGKVHRYVLDISFFDINRFDTVVFDNSVVSSNLIKKFKRVGMKTITIHHNYQVQYLLGDGIPLTVIPNLLWTLVYEKQAVRNSTLNITLTEQDIKLLKCHYGKNYAFAVLGVFEYQQKEIANIIEEERKHRYVITGGLGSKQTEKSIIHWIKKYYPILLSIDSSAELTIAGSNPSKYLSKTITANGITLIDTPVDMAPVLQGADYYLNPVDCGGGLKLRNLDGLKYGLPVLTHKVSLRGYEKMEKKGVVFSYDSPISFANGLKRLLAVSLSKVEMQALYYQQYRFDNGVNKLTQILKENSII